MMKSFFAFLFFFLSSFFLSAQIEKVHIFAGMNYGGPLPQKSMEGASGTPIIGLNAGSGYTIKLSEKFSIIPELYFSFKGVEYSSSYTRDTMVQITIMGVPGEVPSYYTAYVNGKMNFHYLDLPVMVGYRAKKTQILFGPYVSQIIAGKDEGSVRVMIGDGGFYDDYYDDFNNNSFVNKTDYGIILGSTVPLYNHLMFELKVSRSLRPIYKKGFFSSNGNPENKLFNTFLHLSLAYKFADQ